MTQQEGLTLAAKIVNTIMADLAGRSGIFDGVDRNILEEIREDLVELVIDDLPFIDDGTRT